MTKGQQMKCDRKRKKTINAAGILSGNVERVESTKSSRRALVSFPMLGNHETWVKLDGPDSDIAPGRSVVCLFEEGREAPVIIRGNDGKNAVVPKKIDLPMGISCEVRPDSSSFEITFPDGGHVRWSGDSGEISIGASGNVRIASEGGSIVLEAPGEIAIESGAAMTMKSANDRLVLQAGKNLHAASGGMVTVHSRSHATLQSTEGKVHVVSEEGMDIEARGDDLIIKAPYIRMN
jgi:hypothetical protein